MGLNESKKNRKKKKVILCLDETKDRNFFHWNFVNNTTGQAYRKNGYTYWDYEVATGKLFIWDEAYYFENYVSAS